MADSTWGKIIEFLVGFAILPAGFLGITFLISGFVGGIYGFKGLEIINDSGFDKTVTIITYVLKAICLLILLIIKRYMVAIGFIASSALIILIQYFLELNLFF
ncbi:hypothetical protein HOK51_05030 [Candidatus Woesearchaeota archaeon]|jgi:hypothetical protein|nr:hypothetical protein [Candidatus Woesearchaeota archaeon]MBT6519190.1 hypothetical protein [Candidatus Woesearchaeota archaeon]MBT7367652.1 hypothetical protein [Candidatus Woesearchaeota archaeon]